MKKSERERRIHEKTAQQLVHRRYNKAHPVEHEAKLKVRAAERLARIARREGVVAMRAERRRQKNLLYKTNRAARHSVFKKIANWLKPPANTKEEQAKEQIRKIMSAPGPRPTIFKPMGAK